MSDSKEGLVEAVIRLVKSTHPDLVMRLASLVHGCNPASGADTVEREMQMLASKQQMQDMFDAWRTTRVTGAELAGMLVGACHAYVTTKSEVKIELVWTGPPGELVATRRTEQVLVEVIDSSRERIFMTSFVIHPVESIIDALVAATGRGVELSILLASSESIGGTSYKDPIEWIKAELPGAIVYHWSNKGKAFEGGKVHAKVVVSDGNTCFISSANLTSHAMEKNMELGVLIKGGDIPSRLHSHLEAMVTTGVIHPET